MKHCMLCPRRCGIDRECQNGRCGAGDRIYVSRTMLHMWEEPPVSGTRGSGAIFFCGCPLGCKFCQNFEISGTKTRENLLREYSEHELSELMLSFQQNGAHNVNLVSPTQYTPELIRAIGEARRRGLEIPIVWNTGGYERRDTVRSLKGSVDIFLTDLKYFDSGISSELADAPDYFDEAFPSLLEMIDMTGDPVFNEDGIMTSGVIVRHLVLPGCREDSIALLRKMADSGLAGHMVLSLMSQYTPDYFKGCRDPRLDRSLRRRITSFEYDSVCREAERLDFVGFTQQRESSDKSYTPNWGIWDI